MTYIRSLPPFPHKKPNLHSKDGRQGPKKHILDTVTIPIGFYSPSPEVPAPVFGQFKKNYLHMTIFRFSTWNK